MPPRKKGVIYRAAAELPYNNRDQATAGLRGQLRVMIVAGGGTPDWSTLTVEGPTEVVGAHGRTWYEWRATVVVDGGIEPDDPDPVLILQASRPAETLHEETAPQPRAL